MVVWLILFGITNQILIFQEQFCMSNMALWVYCKLLKIHMIYNIVKDVLFTITKSRTDFRSGLAERVLNLTV